MSKNVVAHNGQKSIILHSLTALRITAKSPHRLLAGLAQQGETPL